MADSLPNNSSRSRIPDAILLAGASAVSYAVAYAYRSGFASFYDLPPVLSTPTIGSILQASAAVGVALLFFWLLLNGLWLFLPRRDSAIKRSILRLFLILAIIILTSYSLLSSYRWGWLLVPGALCLYGFAEFVFPLLTQRDVEGYENKIAAQEKVEAGVTDLTDHLVRRIGNKVFLLLFAAYVLINFAHSLGYSAAEFRQDFFVLADRPDYVVALMDDELVVLVEYDPAHLRLKKKYDIRRMTSQSRLLLQKRHIGKLEAPPKVDEPEIDEICPKCI
ncbi:MAG TPA: hypothetical protein VJU77_03145 [Chthoniobacterales bacterium]|nr:hypothetical protein [Chthoniobacterales bacterium]